MAQKTSWSGLVLSVQPRIRLTRSFDERGRSYLGYALFIEGEVDGVPRRLSVGIGPAAQAKHQFQARDRVSGQSMPVADPRREPVEFYRASKLAVERSGEPLTQPPPWHGVPPELETYRWRGHRRLSARIVPGRKGMKWQEPDWLDDEETSQRGPDE